MITRRTLRSVSFWLIVVLAFMLGLMVGSLLFPISAAPRQDLRAGIPGRDRHSGEPSFSADFFSVRVDPAEPICYTWPVSETIGETT